MASGSKIFLNPGKDRSNIDLGNIPFVQQLLDSLPYSAFIIDENRQVLLANQELLDMIQPENNNDIIGSRPGEMIGCVNTKGLDRECGSTNKCQFCGTNGAILQSFKTKEKATRESRLIINRNGMETDLDLTVSSAPLNIGDIQLFVVSLIDKTEEKRKRVMERVFFHDVLNLAHGLGNTLQISQMNECSEIGGRTLENAKMITRSLLGEIIFQRNLMSAEAGDLNIKTSTFGSLELLKDMVDHMVDSKESVGKDLIIDSSSQDFTIESDRSLLGRVLINMIKNALEATRAGEKVEISCQAENNNCILSVHNGAEMTNGVKAQLWQRSFSTKGEDRGIGTYSMKLFTEEYLGGSIDFTSEVGEGTIFSVRLPLPQ